MIPAPRTAAKSRKRSNRSMCQRETHSWFARITTSVLAGITLLVSSVAGEEAESRFLKDTPRPQPIVPAPYETIHQAVRRGVTFLVEDQNKDGSWGSATRTKSLNIYAPIPGSHQAFRAATTSLAISALIQSRDGRAEVREAIQRGEDWLIENLRRVRRANGDAIYNVWGHAYAIEALIDLHGFGAPNDDRREQLRDLIASQVDMLERFESVDGGWGYYDFRAEARTPTSNPTSFTTATGLIALHRAEQLGVKVPRSLRDRAETCIRRQRKPDFTYLYSFNGPTKTSPLRGINRPGGSLGRSQACNLALRMVGDSAITDQVLNVWLDRLFARNGWLDIGRKRPIPHEAHFQVAGYFYYYGHWYAARTFPLLPPSDRQRHQAQMGRLMVDLQEKDGSWWDYPLYDYHQPYGTSMAVMTLMHCFEDTDITPSP